MPENTIDWDGVVGDGADGSWEDDRLRKFGRIKLEAEALVDIADALSRLDALHQASPEVVNRVPGSADWYVCLACFAQKTLSNLGYRAEQYGLGVSPLTFLKNMRVAPGRIRAADVASFCDWVNAEIASVLPTGMTDPRLYAIHVAMVIGGRVIGQGQNEGGEIAVGVLKQAMLAAYGPLDLWQYNNDDDLWATMTGNKEAGLRASMWKYVPTHAVVDFRAGGNRPDIRINRAAGTTLVGEIKGRKDLSNTWESWMPQLVDHFRTWTGEFPEAKKGLFMTVITPEMVTGQSAAGTQRTGLRQLHNEGALDFVVNLTKLPVARIPAEVLCQIGVALGVEVPR